MDMDALAQALEQIKQATDDIEAEMMHKKMSPDEEDTEAVDNPEEDAAEEEMPGKMQMMPGRK